MKVLVIDPWCNDYDGLAGYTIGLCEGLADNVELTLCSGYYESHKTDRYNIHPIFFRFSDKMKNSVFRKIVRGIEYICSYVKIYRVAKRRNFDVIHIQWALLYKADYFFYKALRKKTKKMVYTSHNVIPHVNGEQYVHELRKLHSCFDKILVHGEKVRKEYLQYFPEEVDKLYIQRHGVHLTQKKEYQIDKVDQSIVDFINKKKARLCVCAGIIFYNKGTDRVVKYWLENKSDSEDLLIVAGKYEALYTELDELLSRVSESNNIMFYPKFLSQDEFAYVLSMADFLAIPYRHASMSGLVYSAAAFSKPIIYTDTGALDEYVDKRGGLKVGNSAFLFEQGMNKMLQMGNDELVEMGEALHEWIYCNFDWNKIAGLLVKEVYQE